MPKFITLAKTPSLCDNSSLVRRAPLHCRNQVTGIIQCSSTTGGLYGDYWLETVITTDEVCWKVHVKSNDRRLSCVFCLAVLLGTSLLLNLVLLLFLCHLFSVHNHSPVVSRQENPREIVSWLSLKHRIGMLITLLTVCVLKGSALEAEGWCIRTSIWSCQSKLQNF